MFRNANFIGEKNRLVIAKTGGARVATDYKQTQRKFGG